MEDLKRAAELQALFFRAKEVAGELADLPPHRVGLFLGFVHIFAMLEAQQREGKASFDWHDLDVMNLAAAATMVPTIDKQDPQILGLAFALASKTEKL